MHEIKVPSVGESITEVTIAQWLKPQGSWVNKDESVVTLETDKVNVDVPAPSAGVLVRVLKAATDTAKIGEVIGQIDPTAKPSVGAAPGKAAPAEPAAAQPAASAKSAAPSQGGAPRVMPAAERLMATSGTALEAVTATGPGGRVLKEDVARAAVVPSAAPPSGALRPSVTVDTGSLEQVVPMTPLRRRIAERLVQAQQTAAILTTFNEVDMTATMALRKRHQDAFVKKYGIKLGFMSFFVKAAVDALKSYPDINAEIRGTDLIYRNYFDIGVAVGTERGLVVPILRKAELMSFADVELAISDFAKRGNAGKLKLEELQGGTFTITNGGVYGSLMSTPILNPPQSGILGMHSILDRPIGVDGKIELRPMMYIALSYDHRVVDGKGAVGFLKRIKECIEAPERMLVEI